MKPIAVLDIGSSKIVCLCGSTSGRDGTVVHGAGIVEYSGYANCTFYNPSDLEASVISSIRQTEENARIRIRDIVLSVPAPFSKLVVTESSIRMESTKERVSASDIDELISLALSKANSPGYILMHSTPLSFCVDGYETPDVPQGKRAGEVKAKVSHMYVEEGFLKTITEILDKLSIEISMCVSSQLAESLLLIQDEERIRPAALIDVGFTHTDISVVENSALKMMKTIDLGGFHFTNDLAYGLDIPFSVAEQVKRKYSFLEEGSNNEVTIRMLTGVKTVSQKAVDLIMEARADEFVELIGSTLLEFHIRPDTKPAVYLTGGGISMMRGGSEYLRQMLGLNIRRDMPYIPDMDTPNYASAFGTLDFVLKTTSQSNDDLHSTEDDRNVFDKIKDLFVS